MDRETGPFGLKKQFSYQEVLRNIQQQPYDVPVPARACGSGTTPSTRT